MTTGLEGSETFTDMCCSTTCYCQSTHQRPYTIYHQEITPVYWNERVNRLYIVKSNRPVMDWYQIGFGPTLNWGTQGVEQEFARNGENGQV